MSKNKQKKKLLEFSENEVKIDFMKSLKRYFRYYPWFIISVSICIILGFVYLSCVDEVFLTEAKIKIIDDKNNSTISLDLSKVFNKSNINLENEIQSLESYHLLGEVVKNLRLDVVYVVKNKFGNPADKDNIPFKVTYAFPQDSLASPIAYNITITKHGYTIVDLSSGKTFKTKSYVLNKPTSNFPIVIQPTNIANTASFENYKYKVILKSIKLSAIDLADKIVVEPLGKESDIISLSIMSHDKRYAQKVLNNLIKVYENDGVRDKQKIYTKTIDFVNDRFVLLKKELDSIELFKRNYKKNNKLSFIEADAEENLKINSVKEHSVFDINSQILLVDYLSENLDKSSDTELLPADIGIQNILINELITKYNEAVIEYKRMLTSAGNGNPLVENLVNSLTVQKNNISNSLNRYRSQLKLSRHQSEIDMGLSENSFSAIPEKERFLRSIEREQNLKESLYLLLLQKREEASINLAASMSNTKIVDYAVTNDIPIYPKKSVVFLLCIVIGLSIPLEILWLIFLFDNKVYNVNDIENLSNISILGELPSFTEKSKITLNENDPEMLEGFASVATNLQFIIPNTNHGKVIFVTSSVMGEGKSFISFHLANAFARVGKKVLLVGADLRKPSLHNYISQSSQYDNKGLSNYLYNSSIEWLDLLHKAVSNLSADILLSGDIPPNPSLLLSSHRFNDFMEEAKNLYDFIIVDTCPVVLVADTFIIAKYADTTLYVIRSGVTDKKLIKYSSNLSSDKKLNNMAYIINDITYNENYNQGFGYGYDVEIKKKNFFTNLLRK